MDAATLPAETSVLVIGGGPVGLVASGLLSRLGVRNVVVERRAEVQRAPAAHVMRPRPMQVFDLLGVGNEIRAASPSFGLDYITWCATLGGAEAGRLDVGAGAGGGEALWTQCSQNLLEPILREHVAKQPHAQLVTGAECLEVEQDERGVHARVRCEGGAERHIDAAWAIAADGSGSPVRRTLGIPMLGQGAIGRFFMIHFEADLRPWMETRSGPLFWIINPESAGTLIVHDPARSHVFMSQVRGEENEAAALPGRLAAALRVSAATRILSVDQWSPHVQVAERYRAGRIFLVGDAAHRFPPTGGLGLNTGVLDAHNLVWKLVRVAAGEANGALLDTYETECRPAAQTNAEASFQNMLGLGEVSRAIGPCSDLAALEQRLASMTADERAELARAIEAQRSHFVSDGQLPESREEQAVFGAAGAYA